MNLDYALALGLALALLIWGGLTTDTGDWYQSLRKPAFQPPGWVFGPAWTVILALAAVAAVLGWRADPEHRTVLVLLFAGNAVLHAVWSPLFFRARRPDLALVEVALLLLSVASLIAELLPRTPLGALLVIPYLLWVGFALILNLQIVRLNPGLGRRGAQGRPSPRGSP